MKILSGAFLLLFSTTFCDFSQPAEMRGLCKEAQELEADISKLTCGLREIEKREKMSAPAIINIYEVLSRYCTVLANIQRYSDFLVLTKYENRNDFIRCSTIIKSFTDYFKSVSQKLEKDTAEISKLKKEKSNLLSEYEKALDKYKKTCEAIDAAAKELTNSREENVIQNDVVYHIATKSESIEELDAELEAENTVGVLKNTKVSTELSLAYPVKGKIVSEFGDRGDDGDMICYLGFETNREAIVTSPAKGVVVFSGNFLNYKNMIIISNGEYRIFLYGIKSMFASTGDTVEIGDYIGKMEDNSEQLPIIKMELKKSGEPLDPRHWLLQSIERENRK